MLQLKLPYGVAGLLLIVGTALSLGLLVWYPNGLGTQEAASGMMITFLGVLLTSESILILIASVGFARWPSVGRILKHSGFYVVLMITGIAATLTTLGHLVNEHHLLLAGLVFWALAALSAGGSLAMLLVLCTKPGRTWLLRKELAHAMAKVNKAHSFTDQSLHPEAVTDYLSAVQHSSAHVDGGDLLDLINQLCFAKTQPASFPAYNHLEMEVIRIIFRAVAAGTLAPEVSYRALHRLLVQTKAPVRSQSSRQHVVSHRLSNLTFTIHYLSWLEAALLSEYRAGELGRAALRRTIDLAQSLRDLLTREHSGVDGKPGLHHTNPDHAITTAAEALLYFAMAGDYAHSTTWYSQYVFYEAVSGLRFNGDFFTGRPILSELADIIYHGGSQPEHVTEYRQREGFVTEICELLPTRESFDTALTLIFCERIATAWGRVAAQDPEQGAPYLHVSKGSIQSLFRAAGSLMQMKTVGDLHRGITNALFAQETPWSTLHHELIESYHTVSPARSAPITDRLAPLVLVFLCRLAHCDALQNGTELRAAVATLDEQILAAVGDVLEDLAGLDRDIDLTTAVTLKMKELVH